MAYSTTFDNLDSLLRSLSSNSASSPYEINITDILPANLKGNQTASSGTMQYVLQQNPTKYVSLNIPQQLNIDDYSYMFYDCPTLVKLDMPNTYSRSGGVSWVNAFNNCTNLKSVNLSFNEETVSEAVGMFYGCSKLESADLNDWTPDSNQYMNQMFYGCTSLKKVFRVKTFDFGFQTFYGVTTPIDFYCSDSSVCYNLASYSYNSAAGIYGSTSVRGKHTFYNFEGCEFLPSSVTKDSSTGVITVNHADVSDMIYYNLSHNNELGLTTNTLVPGNCKIQETDISGRDWAISSAWKLASMYFYKDDSSFPSESTSNIYMSPDYSYTTNMPSTVDTDILVANSNIYKLPSLGSATILNASNCPCLVDYPVQSPFLQRINMSGCRALPEEIEMNLPALTTASGAFYSCSQIKKIKITGCATMDSMFSGCTSLEEVEFTEGNSVPSSLSNTFASCTNLKTVRMPFSIPASDSNTFPSTLSSTVKLFFTEQTYAFNSAKAINSKNIFSAHKTNVKCYFCPDAIDDVTEPESLSIDSAGIISINQDEIEDLALWNDWNGDVLNLDGATAASPVLINEKNITGTSWTNDFLNIQATADYGYYISDSNSSPTLIMAPDATRYAGLFVDFSNTVLPSSVVTINDDNDTHITATPVPAPSPAVISSYSFENCTALKNISCDASKTYKIASMAQAFKGCTSLESWGAAQKPLVAITTNGSEMFRDCTSLESVDMPEGVINTSRMFQGCTALESIDLKNKSDITDASYMFSGCTALEDIHNFDIPKTIPLTSIFQNCSSLANVFIKTPAPGTNTSWQLVKAVKVSGGLTVSVYSGVDTEHETLVLVGTATLQGLNRIQMLGLTDEILFSDNVTDQNLYDFLNDQFQFGLPGEGLPSKKDCFTLWAENPSNFFSNIDFSSTRLEYSSGAGLCKTIASLAEKKVDILNYTLTSGSNFVVTFTNDNSYSGALTLNVNNTGAKSLYLNGTASSSTNHTLPAGSYNVTYDGSYYYIETSHSVASARESGQTNDFTNIGITRMVDLIYPVGSVYISVNSTDPDTLFPGTHWDQISQGRVLMGVGTGQDSWGYTLNVNSEDTGGEYKHHLKFEEMPRHTHTIRRTKQDFKWTRIVTDTVDGSWGEAATSYQESGSTSYKNDSKASITIASVNEGRDRDWTGRSGDALRSLSYSGTHMHEADFTGGETNEQIGTDGKGHDIVQPYFAVCMWKRRS